jgi:hypothetical protein
VDRLRVDTAGFVVAALIEINYLGKCFLRGKAEMQQAGAT